MEVEEWVSINHRQFLSALLVILLVSCGTEPAKKESRPGEVSRTADVKNRDPGIYINDDAPVASSLEVVVNVVAPAGAATMALSESDSTIGLAWEAVALTKPFKFANGGKRTLYARFKDASGAFLGVFVDTIEIDIFGIQGNALTINGGAKNASSRTLNLTIQVPANAKDMMLSENETLKNGSWVPVAAQKTFEVAGMQMRYVYLKYRTAQQIESKIYSAAIMITPFADDAADLKINGGSATTTSPVLALTIKVPSNAVAMKVYGASDELSASWVSPNTSATYTAQTGGLTLVNLKFRDAENNESQVWASRITIDLFPVANMNFSLSFTNQAPSLRANLSSIQANSYAATMMISGRPSFKDATWVTFASSGTINLSFCETTTKIYVKFRDAYGYVSETIERSAAATCTGISAMPCNTKAEDLYILNISPKTEGNCQSCHSAGGNNQIKFIAGNPTAIRTTLLNYTGATATKFINKMNGTTPHSGGIQDLPASKIQPWFDQEKICGN